MKSKPDYTLIVGVDRKHLQQLAWVWPTWKLHKPGLLQVPMIVFYDRLQVDEQAVRTVVDHPLLQVVPWSNSGSVVHAQPTGEPPNKWNDSQRCKMLAGFVYVPAMLCKTAYWLKIDTDTVAVGRDDWIDPKWFDDDPAIVSHPWGFTKPADQMLDLDRWVEDNRGWMPALAAKEPLQLEPKPGWSRVRHKRIISWCAFFQTDFTRLCADCARNTVGDGLLPVQSQDGYLFYVAKRLGLGIERVNMKNRGWEHWSTNHNVRTHAAISLSVEQNHAD